MSRNWSKYINNNKYSECQLINALNAYYCLTDKVYCEQDSQEYEDLVDFVKARNGAAIDIEKVWKKLGIEIVWEGMSLHTLKQYLWEKNKYTPLYMPIEFNNWSMEHGNHTSLIIEYKKHCDLYRITNFSKYTTSEGWLFGSELYKYESYHDQRDNDVYRLFGLIGDPNLKAIKQFSNKEKKKWFKAQKKYYADKCRELGIT